VDPDHPLLLPPGELSYESCLIDTERTVVWPFLPHQAKCGRKLAYPIREVMNAIDCVLRRGVARRLMCETAAVIDHQCVSATESGSARGYDAGDKIKTPKRHALMDADGRPLEFQLPKLAVRVSFLSPAPAAHHRCICMMRSIGIMLWFR
jgi:transposase